MTPHSSMLVLKRDHIIISVHDSEGLIFYFVIATLVLTITNIIVDIEVMRHMIENTSMEITRPSLVERHFTSHAEVSVKQ